MGSLNSFVISFIEMKPDKEGQDSHSTFIRHAIGKDPFSTTGGKQIPFELWKGEPTDVNEAKEPSCSSNDNEYAFKGTKASSEQMQALRFPEAFLAFAQAAARANGEPEKYVPGWPLLSSPKVQFQKCEKCSREFCSTINYRRHILVHRRSLNIDKDFPKNRDFLGLFWDKLSLEDGKDFLSFINMDIEEVNGSSLVRSLSSWIRKPLFFSSLPQAYVKAGSALLDLIQEKPSSSRLSSEELFGILDNASEKTFLSTGTATSVQKFVFDGQVSKIALDMKNLIACVSFMLEQKLVKAWHTDKDAEAWKYHKLLMEEEEGAKRREAELLERKRLKKLKQKEQKSKDLFEEGNRVSSPITEKIDSPRSDFNTTERENEGHHPVERTASVGPTAAIDVRMDTEVDDCNFAQDQMNPRHSFLTQYKPKRTIRNGLTVQFPGAKPSVSMRYGPYKDLKATSSATNKIWTQKNKHEELPYNRIDRVHQDQSVNPDNSEVIIGSILVALGNSDRTRSKPGKFHTKQHNIKPPNGMLWKPVGHHENRSGMSSVLSMTKENFIVSSCEEFTDPVPANETNFFPDERMDSTSEAQQDLLMVRPSTGPILFSSKITEAFLAQRWKETIVANHVRLDLPSEVEVFDDYDTAENGHNEVMPEKSCASNGLEKGHDGFVGVRSCTTEKGSLRAGSIEPSNSSKHKFRTKPEKNSKLNYVPKQTQGHG